MNGTYDGRQRHAHLSKVVKEPLKMSTLLAELTFGRKTVSFPSHPFQMNREACLDEKW